MWLWRGIYTHKNAKGALLKFEVVRRPSAPRPGEGGVVGAAKL
jgi:hypothetical protein